MNKSERRRRRKRGWGRCRFGRGLRKFGGRGGGGGSMRRKEGRSKMLVRTRWKRSIAVSVMRSLKRCVGFSLKLQGVGCTPVFSTCPQPDSSDLAATPPRPIPPTQQYLSYTAAVRISSVRQSYWRCRLSASRGLPRFPLCFAHMKQSGLKKKKKKRNYGEDKFSSYSRKYVGARSPLKARQNFGPAVLFHSQKYFVCPFIYWLC